jgi:uncharacterized protein YbcI
MCRFEQDYMGRGPKNIHTHLLGDLLVVRLQGVLTAAEQHLVKSLSAEKGRDLLKQVRTHLIETARPIMEAMVQEITGVKVLTMHHDIRNRRGGCSLYPCRVANSPRRKEEIARLSLPLVCGRWSTVSITKWKRSRLFSTAMSNPPLLTPLS